MRQKLLVTLLLVCGMVACEVNQELNQQQEAERLQEMLSKIQQIAGSESCTNASEWRIAPYGSKPCGGPQGFIAYSSQIDTKEFLELIEEHRKEEEAFNKKWGAISDCSVSIMPANVVCENGEPKFEF